MKFGLTFVIMGILLSACSDGKENTEDTQTLTTTSRTVATDYQIVDMDTDQQTECLFSLDGSQPGKLLLNSGQHVTLANKETTTVMHGDIAWLAVVTDDQATQPCYIKTQYLEPVPAN